MTDPLLPADESPEAPQADRRRLLGLLATAAGLVSTAACAQSSTVPAAAPVPKPVQPPALCPEILGKTVRLIRPGQPMTRDYRQDRLTIMLDADDRITSIQVG